MSLDKPMSLSTFELFKNLKTTDRDCLELSDEQLKQLQDCLYSMLLDIDMVCNDHNLTYLLSGGTALGALRHSGFIPWDDDLDINMPRGDFLRLSEILNKNFNKKYIVEIPGVTPGFYLTSGRIRLKNTIYQTRGDDAGEQGIFVDIFIVEDIPDSRMIRYLHGFLCLTFGFLLSCRLFYFYRKSYKKLLSFSRKARTIFRLKTTIGGLLGLVPVSSLTSLTNKIYSACNNHGSKFVSIPSGRKHYFGELYRREGFLRKKFLLFESKEFPVSFELEDYLTKLYGPEYMTPPPEDKRERHIIYKIKLPERK